MAVRLKDIAEKLALSVSTVSAALQNRGDISPRTRERVLAMVREMGYQPNSVARSLVTRRSHVLGVVVPDLSRSFFAELLKGIDAVASEAGYNLLVCNTDENAEKEKQMLRMLCSRQVDGLLIASAHNVKTLDWKRTFANLAVPAVFMDRPFPRFHFVGGNDEEIGWLATTHLVEQGYQRIAHIAGPQTVSTAVGRAKGYVRALKKLGLPVGPETIVETNYHEESGGYEAMQRLLALKSPPDAVFAASDPIGIGVMQAALDARLQMPEQFGLIGVGNHQYSKYLRVPMSTMDQQRGRIGHEAARLLLGLLAGSNPAAPKQIFVEPRLIIRASSSRLLESE